MNDTMTPQELRAQADAMEREANKDRIGLVFIGDGGQIFIHDGSQDREDFVKLCLLRQASDAEIQALRTIPEFAARLDKVRAG